MWRNLVIVILIVVLLGLVLRISQRLVDNEVKQGIPRDEPRKVERNFLRSEPRVDANKVEPKPRIVAQEAPADLEPLEDGLRLLAQGRIVDDRNEPIPDLLVRVEGDSIVQPVDVRMAEHGVRTDFAGCFSLRGRNHSEFSLLIESNHDENFRHRLDGFRPSRKKHLITLPRLSCLEGQLIAAPGTDLDWLEVKLRDGNSNLMARTLVDDEGRFRLTHLSPGLTCLDVGFLGSEATLVQLQGLRLEPGEVCDDDRLRRIELPRTPSMIQFRAVDGGNRGVGDATVIVHLGNHRDGRPRFRSFKTNPDGALNLPIIAEGYDLEISHPDFELARKRVVSRSETLILSPAQSLRLEVLGEVGDLGSQLRLQLRLRFDQNRRLGSDELWALRVPDQVLKVDELEGAVSCSLRAPGKYLVEIEIVSVDRPELKELVGTIWLQLKPDESSKRIPMKSLKGEFERAQERLELRLQEER